MKKKIDYLSTLLSKSKCHSMSQVGLSQTSQGFYILLFLDCTFMSAITQEILAVSCPWKQGNFLRSQTNLKSHFWYYRCFQEGICGSRIPCGKLVASEGSSSSSYSSTVVVVITCHGFIVEHSGQCLMTEDLFQEDLEKEVCIHICHR